jgi:hypothetical protein
MRALQTSICCLGLVLALAPVAAFADSSGDHKQQEIANAEAQLALALQEVDAINAAASESASNDRTIALQKSTVLRQAQLDNMANAAALQQQAAALADQIRTQGDENAANELAILQIKAGALVTHADASLANAFAIGRADEIANAQAQDAAAHQLADYMTTTLAQQNMSNDQIIADDAAAAVDDSAQAEAQNDVVLGDDDVLAADDVLSAANVSAVSDTIAAGIKVDTILGHALDSLANAKAQADEIP